METVNFNPEQLDYIVTAIVMVGACICFCLGLNAWENSAK